MRVGDPAALRARWVGPWLSAPCPSRGKGGADVPCALCGRPGAPTRILGEQPTKAERRSGQPPHPRAAAGGLCLGVRARRSGCHLPRWVAGGAGHGCESLPRRKVAAGKTGKAGGARRGPLPQLRAPPAPAPCLSRSPRRPPVGVGLGPPTPEPADQALSTCGVRTSLAPHPQTGHPPTPDSNKPESARGPSPPLRRGSFPGGRTSARHPPAPGGCWGARIVGGREVNPHSRPYMASVRFQGEHHCGGFLLRPGWVVSAAHCFVDRDLRAGLVVLGAHSLRTPEPTQQVFAIRALVRHPDYEPVSHAGDLCLLQLNGSAVLGPAVGLLGLPRRSGGPPPGTQCRVAGWGSVSDFEEPPPGLMEANVQVLRPDACNSSWGGRLRAAMLCTRSGDRQRRGFCSADSGGPLVCQNRAQGVVSFSGIWCGDPKTPDVYTRLSAFSSWIRGVLRRGPPPGTQGLREPGAWESLPLGL